MPRRAFDGSVYHLRPARLECTSVTSLFASVGHIDVGEKVVVYNRYRGFGIARRTAAACDEGAGPEPCRPTTIFANGTEVQ